MNVRSPRFMIAGVLILAAVAAVVTVLVLRGGSGGGSTLPPPPVGLDAARQELLGLLANGRGLTYHAHYETTGPSAGLPNTIDVWRKGSLLRADTETRTAGHVVSTAAFSGPGGTKTCRRDDQGSWSCTAAQSPGGEGALIDQLGADLAGRRLTASSATVRSRQVRCFSEAGTASGRICLTPDGVVTLIQSGTRKIELVSIDRTVVDVVFNPPA
jgi:hypothetical protein